jgi:MYXO-CTERM domain-containing protein
MDKKIWMKAAAMIVTTGTIAPTTQAALFTNGGFESPTVSGGFIIFGPGSGPAGWTYGTDPAAPQGGVVWNGDGGPVSPAPSGRQMASLNDPNGTNLGSISQTFNTLPGKSYVVSFALSGIADGGADNYGVNVSATGNAPSFFNFNTGAAANLAVPAADAHTYAFTAAGPSTTLSFSSTNFAHDFYGPVLDRVQLDRASLGPNLIVNGNFEANVIANFLGVPGNQNGGSAPSGSITGWQDLGIGVTLVHRGAFDGPSPLVEGSAAASDGDQWLSLENGFFHTADGTGKNGGGVQQAFATTPGNTYSVSFDFSSLPRGANESSSFLVQLDGQTIDTLTVNTAGFATVQNVSWQTYNFDFIAAGGTSTLTFLPLDNYDASFFGAAIDNVRANLIAVSIVPEPAGLALLSVAGLALLRRRK